MVYCPITSSLEAELASADDRVETRVGDASAASLRDA